MDVAPHIQPVWEQAKAAFATVFGGEPVWGAGAPGRVNLIGEHTDYNEGFVLPMAIDRVCVAVCGPSRDPAVSRVYSTDFRQTMSGDMRGDLVVKAHGVSGPGVERGSWLSYVVGPIAKMRMFAPRGLRNMDIAIASSVPLGAGLSSSAAVEVAVATLMQQVIGVTLDPRTTAELCQQAEHEFAGVPCGIMDQLVAVTGKAGRAILVDCRSNVPAPITFPPGLAVVVVNSNVRHSLAAGEYAARRAVCAAAAAKMGLRSLRDAQLEVTATLTGDEQRCARHVYTENARVLAAVQALQSGDWAGLGALMVQSHLSLRDDFRVSCVELDFLVAAAMGMRGVYGARMTGGGFGGSIVIAADPGAVPMLIEGIIEVYRRAQDRECDCFVVNPADGAGPVLSAWGPAGV